MEKVSILEMIINQVELRINRPLTPVERPVILDYVKDAATVLEKRLAMVATEAAERIKHDTGI